MKMYENNYYYFGYQSPHDQFNYPNQPSYVESNKIIHKTRHKSSDTSYISNSGNTFYKSDRKIFMNNQDLNRFDNGLVSVLNKYKNRFNDFK